MRLTQSLAVVSCLVVMHSLPITEAAAQRLASTCGSERKRAKEMHEVINATVGLPPLLQRWATLREIAPEGERDRAVRFEARIDEKGEPIASSIRIGGLDDTDYQKKLQSWFRLHRFAPARIDGCVVTGVVVIELNVRDNGELTVPPLQYATHHGTILTASFGPECADVRARVRAGTLLASDSVNPAAPLSVMLPPMPVPQALHGRSVPLSVRVDSSGTAIDSAVSLPEFKPASYRKKMLSSVKLMTFRPTILRGCAAEGTVSLTYTL